MGFEFKINENEREILRELAKRYMEYASLPIMDERKELWYAHNSLKAQKPLIVIEMESFEDDMLPPSKCVTPIAKEIEKKLTRWIICHEKIDDDKVIPPYLPIDWKMDIKEFGLEIVKEHAKDGDGREIGFTQKHPIHDLEEDFDKIKPSTYSVDKEYTLTLKSFIEDIIGDIIPVRIKNDRLNWSATPSQKVVDLMGLETMMYSMFDYPEYMHKLYAFLRDDIIRFVRWQEREGLLTLNNKYEYAGAGSYGFTNELPRGGRDGVDISVGNAVMAKDLWLNINSQETVGISADMYGEFIAPYYHEIAKEFGLVYYGCCEPVHPIWKDYVSKLPGLRKVSISPWCDEEFMGEALRNSNVIYSRKPSPNFIGVGAKFDEDGFKAHIEKTLNAAKGCQLEFIQRDVYTVSGDQSKPGRAVKIIRELIEKTW